jgi:outer membrane PBP1 activator LpoA protein
MTGLYQQAFNDGADFIVGPILKDNVQQLSSGSFTIPVLALNYTDVNWSLPSHFYEYGLLPEDEAAQIADRAHEAGHSRAIIIAPKNAWGNRMVAAFTPRWQADGGSVQDSWYYTPGGKYNKEVAQLMKVNPVDGRQPGTQQRRQDFDVIFLFSQPQDSHAIVPMLRYYYVGNVPIYATSAVYSGKPNPTRDVDLNGVIICDIPWSMRVAQSASGDSVQSDRLYAVGQDAYMLSQSMQRFSQLPNFPIYGKTGALVMSSTHQIHRRLPCVPVRNGLI